VPYADRDLWGSLVYQNRELINAVQAVCIQTGFVTPPILATPVETFRPALTARIRAGVSSYCFRDRLRVGRLRSRQRRYRLAYA
jgi:hypothetical protein